MTKRIAGIDVHKSVLMIVVVGVGADGSAERAVEKKKCGTLFTELDELRDWLSQKGVTEVVMESTAQYWKPVWLALENSFDLKLAQAWSNRAPKGRKTDFKDAERLARRHLAGELTLSFVPEPEQRQMRELTRRNAQLNRELVRIQNQIESLLEPTRIKLSGVISDLFGATGGRILKALADGESDPDKLAALADTRHPASDGGRYHRRDRSRRKSISERRPIVFVGGCLSGTRRKRGKEFQRTLRQRKYEFETRTVRSGAGSGEHH